MELRHLRYFAAVAETRHFGRAAERRCTWPSRRSPRRSASSRPSSARALLTRTTRQVSLTPAGEFLYRDAQRVLGAVEDSVRGVRRIAEGRLGLVRIAFTGTAAFTQLPRIARAGPARPARRRAGDPSPRCSRRRSPQDCATAASTSASSDPRRPATTWPCAPSRSSRWSSPSPATTGSRSSRWSP